MTAESKWRVRLDGLPVWRADVGHALVIAPHPDDETLGAGGLIAKLRKAEREVTVVAVTDGENAYANTPGLRETRGLEQTEALACLGVDAVHIHRFALPDSGVGEHEERLVEMLLAVTSETMHLIAPWRGDFHPDHEACGRAAERVAQIRKIPLTSYFFWTWHRGDVEVLDGMPLALLPLDVSEQTAKWQALMCHRSQLEHESGSPILPTYLLEPVHRPFEVFLV